MDIFIFIILSILIIVIGVSCLGDPCKHNWETVHFYHPNGEGDHGYICSICGERKGIPGYVHFEKEDS